MRYTQISETVFNIRYQQLAAFINANANTPFEQLNIPDGHPLKGKNFFVLNRNNRKSFLHKAAAEGDLILITFLKSTGHDINLQDAQHKTALYDACDHLKLAAVNHLLGYDADPNLGNGHLKVTVGNQEHTGETVPLVAAIESKATVTAAELSATGEDFSQIMNDIPTEQARAKIVEKLITSCPNAADVNLQTGEENFSGLHRSIINLQPSTVKVFTDFKDTNFRLVDRDGQAPLHMVVDYRNEEEKLNEQANMQKEKQITELIIPHLEAIDIQDKNGNTPLITAVINSNADVVAEIYKKDHLFPGLKLLSIQNNEGNTAIHEAVKEAKRGPKVLAILLRVATEDDLAITNNDGETAKQLATRLTLIAEQEAAREVQAMGHLVDEVNAAADELESLLEGSDEIEAPIEAPDEIKQLQEATEQLFNYIDHNRATKRLSVEMEGLSIDAGDHGQDGSLSLADAQDLISRARKLVTDTRNEFFHVDYIKNLKSVHQLEYTTWKNDILNKPSSFPNLDVIDTQSAGYQADIAQAYTFFDLGEQFLAVNNNDRARISFEAAIRIYARLKNSFGLERCYQSLAKIYYDESINEGINLGTDAGETLLRNYESKNKAKLLSLDNHEKLQGHLALAGLYKELKDQNYASPSFSSDDLRAHESYHYYHAYKLTQGDLDADAHVVLQHEMGIADRENLGTYNIQQCVAVVAFDPITGKVVLSHFDRFSGPLSFIENLLKEFSGQNKIHLYMTGGRDRVTLVSPSSATKISDNNIDQVLKQIYAEQDRFDIKASDLGDKPSPEAVVFDVQSQRLVHATPDRPDSSLPSREVNFNLQRSKADYLRPLNDVDFTQSVVARTIPFTDPAYALQTAEIHLNVINFTPLAGQTEAWNHQVLYPFITIQNELIGATPNFQQGLLKKALLDRYQGPSLPSNLPCISATRRRRDAGLCEVDSKRLIEDLKDLQKDLPEAKQSEVLEEVATRRMGGTKQEEVATLVRNQKITHRIQKVGKVSSGVMDGLFGLDAISGVRKGNYYPAMVYGGTKLQGYVSGKVAAKMEAKGLESIAEERLLRGNSFRIGAIPVRRVGGMAFAGYDLYNQVSEFQKDGNNTDALVGIVSDGVQISTDVVGGAIEVAEITSERFALMGISEFTGPIGEGVVAIVVVGQRIFEDVEIVEREDQSVHLTPWEKFKEGGLAFLAMEPEAYIKTMIDEVTEYNRILPKKLEFLKNHPEIKHIIFPAIKKTGESCRVVIGERSCSGGGPLFPPTCTNEKTVCDPTFTDDEDNYVYFKNKLIGFTLTREEITAPEGSELLCVPTGKEGNDKHLPEGTFVFPCDFGIGLTNTNTSTANAAYFDFGDGKDHAAGFVNISNIFMVNNGAKDYEGGDQEDTFIILAKNVVTAVNKEGGIGGLDGGAGSDSLLVQGLQPAANRIEICLNAPGFIKNGNDTLAINSFEKLLGGTFPLDVTAGCATEEIHLVGGPTLKNLDTLFIPKNSSCAYDLKMYLQPPVSVTNEVDAGNFVYYILTGKGNVAVNLTANEDNSNAKPLKHQFVFNELISEVSSIQVSAISSDSKQSRTIKLHFLDPRIRTLSRKMQSISLTQPNTTDTVSIAYQLKPDSALNLTRFALLTQFPAAQTRELLKKRLVNPVADSLDVTLIQRHDIHHALLKLVNKVDNESVEDFTFQLNANLSDNTSFQFIDNAELQIGNKNNYLFKQNLNQSVSDIMDKYAPIARRLNLICVLTTQDNEQILIGHNGIEVMQNSPLARTHLNGNGGEGVFVIKSGMVSLFQSRLPLSEVVLYRRPEDKHIDSLDFRALNTQVQAENNVTAKILFVGPNSENKLGDDMLILFGVVTPDTPINKVIEVITVRLKDAKLNHWYKKYLHIYLNDDLPLQIVGKHSQLRLKPMPLKFDLQHEIASVGVNAVEENTNVILPIAYQPGAFFHHNKTNLLWTNTLSNRSHPVEAFTLILEKFFQEPKLKTLSLQFTNKKIALKNKLVTLNAMEDFEEASNHLKAILRAEYSAIMNAKPSEYSSSESSNVTEIEVNLGQEHYLGNDIDATSIEDHTDGNHTEDYSGEEANDIDVFIRERRSVEDVSVPAVTSSASRLQSWINFQHLGSLAETFVRTTGEVFTKIGSNIIGLSSYLPDMNFSVDPDLLDQARLLGNKTSYLNVQPNAIQEYTLNQGVPLKKCVPLKLIDTDQETIDGVGCSIPGAKINFFHNLPFATRPKAFEQPEANFDNCQPLEWYGRPSVVCEGEKTTAIITPHLPQRIFDSVNDWLMLGQLTMAIANKLFPGPVTDSRYQLVDEFSPEQSLLWQTKLNAMEEQLEQLHTRVDGQLKWVQHRLNWIQHRLEDRQEEFDQFTKRNRVTWNEITEFTENLFALEEMLDNVEEIPCPISSSFAPKDNDVYARAASNGNEQNHTSRPDSTAFVSTERLAQGSFFGLTQISGFFNGAANQNTTALLNGPGQTQEVVIQRLHS